MSSAATGHPVSHARPSSGVLIDVAIAAAALGGSLAQLSHGGFGSVHTGSGELDWISGLLAACSTLPLLAWRQAARAVFAITAAACVLLAALGHPLAIALGPAAALFLLAASRDEDDPWTRTDTAMVLGLFAAYLAATWLDDGFPGGEMLHTGLVWAVAWFAGDRTRLRHEHISELAERASRTEREAERERLLAVAEERARISRDLHDAAGNAINVIAVRAGTARMRRDPERSQAALEEIEVLARKTADEIDQMVGTLREPSVASDSVDAPPTLASLDSLVERHAAAGLEVTVSSDGEPRRLDGAVDQAAYRILQESLTNAARHGSGSAAVGLAFRDSALELTITNGASRENGPRSNGGHGLVGMRERVTLLGGDFEAARGQGSFRVRARLPYEGGAA